MGRMRYPSLSLHGIEGAFSAPGAKTVIPAKVSALSAPLRTVGTTNCDPRPGFWEILYSARAEHDPRQRRSFGHHLPKSRVC